MGNKKIRLRPTVEDYLRAAAYLCFVTWTVLFTLLPPLTLLSTTQVITRDIWMGLAFVGGAGAFVGAVSRIDLKVEFPGLLLMQLGPFLYGVSQVWYVIFPIPGDYPNYRIAFIAYAFLPGLLLLPRTYALFAEARRSKKIITTNRALRRAVTSAKSTMAEGAQK